MLKILLNFLHFLVFLFFRVSCCDYLPTLLLLLVKCLVVKVIHLRIIHQYPVHPKSYVHGGHQKQTLSAESKAFLLTVENKFITIKRKYVKGNLTKSKEQRRSLTTWRTDIFFNPDSDLFLRSQDKGNIFVLLINKLILLKLVTK